MTISSSSDSNDDNKPSASGPVVLVLVDSWGVAPLTDGNAFTDLKLKTIPHLIENYPLALLETKGSIVSRYYHLGARGRLTKIISEAGLKQLRLLESEAAPFLEDYFLAGRVDLLTGESREVISSLDGDRTEEYEHQGEVLLKKALLEIKRSNYHFITLSLSHLDLASATGDLATAKEAILVLDKWLARLWEAVVKYRGTLIISSTYGRAESLVNLSSGLPQIDITNHPVPFIIAGENYTGRRIGPDALSEDLSVINTSGTLADVAPTILNILGVKIPPKMPGKNLLA